MILLDTNAVIWLMVKHKRVQGLQNAGRLYLSPVSLLELHFLVEVGRGIQFPAGKTLQDVAKDSRWQLDNPDAAALFAAAFPIGWTRDPFDRLLVAHAKHRRWKLATSDQHILKNLTQNEVIKL